MDDLIYKLWNAGYTDRHISRALKGELTPLQVKARRKSKGWMKLRSASETEKRAYKQTGKYADKELSAIFHSNIIPPSEIFGRWVSNLWDRCCPHASLADFRAWIQTPEGNKFLIYASQGRSIETLRKLCNL